MNSLAGKTYRKYQTTTKSRIKIFIIFLILLIFQSAPAQDQWRVFTTQNSQLPNNYVPRLLLDRNNVKWIGTSEGLVKIDGNNWTIFDTTNTPFDNNGIYPIAVDNFNNLWVAIDSGIAKFNGVNWVIYNTTNSGLPSNAVTCITIDSNNTKWIGTGAGLGKFDDFNWTIYRTTNSGLPDNFVSTIAVKGNDKWIGTFGLYGGMAKFNDTNWVIYNTTNSGIPNNTIHDIKVDNWNIKWIGTHFGGGVGRYNSVSNSWIVYNTQNSGLPDGYVMCIMPHNSIKWFGTQGGGLAGFNDTNWIVFNPSNSPLPSISVLALALDSLGNLWIGTVGGLAVYNPTGVVGNINMLIEIPQVYQLNQNFPNPFNPKTKIIFGIPELSDINISIYDLIGKKVTELLSKELKAGNYEMQWDGTNFSSGVYFYVLSTNKIKLTKKMVLIK